MITVMDRLSCQIFSRISVPYRRSALFHQPVKVCSLSKGKCSPFTVRLLSCIMKTSFLMNYKSQKGRPLSLTSAAKPSPSLLRLARDIPLHPTKENGPVWGFINIIHFYASLYEILCTVLNKWEAPTSIFTGLKINTNQITAKIMYYCVATNMQHFFYYYYYFKRFLFMYTTDS